AEVCRQKYPALNVRGNGWVFVWFIQKVWIIGVVKPERWLREAGAGVQVNKGATCNSLVAAANRIEFNGRRAYRAAVELLNLRQVVANVRGVLTDKRKANNIWQFGPFGHRGERRIRLSFENAVVDRKWTGA